MVSLWGNQAWCFQVGFKFYFLLTRINEKLNNEVLSLWACAIGARLYVRYVLLGM